MKKLMVLVILVLFLLSACAPPGSKPQESNTAEASDSITIVENTDLTGTWSGPYTETEYVEGSPACANKNVGTMTWTLTSSGDTFNGNVADSGAVLSSSCEGSTLDSYSTSGSITGTVSGSEFMGAMELTLTQDAYRVASGTFNLPVTGTISGDTLTATYSGTGVFSDGPGTSYSGSITLRKQSLDNSKNKVIIPNPTANELPSYDTAKTGLPDFIVQDVAWKVLSTQGEGESKIYLVSITPTVSNQGTKDFRWGLPKIPKVTVRIYQDDSTSPEGAKGVESLDVGESKVHEYVTASGYPKEFVFRGGEHTIRVTINEDYPSYETVEEADFSNNEKVITIHLGE